MADHAAEPFAPQALVCDTISLEPEPDRERMITAAYDIHVEKLFGRMKRLHAALSGAGIAYRIIGGMAVYLHVSERDPGKARLTRDVDVAVNREELKRIASAAAPFGFQFRRVAGADMLLDNAEPRASSGIH